MTQAFATINGKRVQRVRVLVGAKGPWVAECDLEAADALAGAVTLTIGALSLSGTIDASVNDTFGGQRRLRIVAGAGKWGAPVQPQAYHNDGGVQARLAAADAARAVGETLGTFVPTTARLGADYVRQRGPASRVLEDATGGADWWVDYAGQTQVGSRATSTPDPDVYEVLAYDPRTRRVELAVASPEIVQIGARLTKHLDTPLVVREIEIRASPDEFHLVAWCGTAEGALVRALRAAVARLTDRALFGRYRYRVVSMAGDRLQLQAARAAAGLPDILPVSVWPGIAGCHAVLTPGAEVLVEFVEGDRTLPIVTAFAGKDGHGFAPIQLTLGGVAGPAAARVGDAVQVTLPPAAFSGTIGGSPATGTVTWVPPATADGVITAGSTKVQIA